MPGVQGAAPLSDEANPFQKWDSLIRKGALPLEPRALFINANEKLPKSTHPDENFTAVTVGLAKFQNSSLTSVLEHAEIFYAAADLNFQRGSGITPPPISPSYLKRGR